MENLILIIAGLSSSAVIVLSYCLYRTIVGKHAMFKYYAGQLDLARRNASTHKTSIHNLQVEVNKLNKQLKEDAT